MTASSDIEGLIGLVLVIYATFVFAVAVWRPKHLEHPLMQPRWFGFGGPRGGRLAVAISSGFWLTLGIALLDNAFTFLPAGARQFDFPLLMFFFCTAVVADLIRVAKNAA